MSDVVLFAVEGDTREIGLRRMSQDEEVFRRVLIVGVPEEKAADVSSDTQAVQVKPQQSAGGVKTRAVEPAPWTAYATVALLGAILLAQIVIIIALAQEPRVVLYQPKEK